MLGASDLELLPTPLALVAKRASLCAPGSAEAFLHDSYIAESTIKLTGIALYGGLRGKANEQAYRMAHELLRADGVGVWEMWIRQASSQPLAGFLPTAYSELLTWLTKARTRPEDDWFREATAHLGLVYHALGVDSPVPDRKPSVRDLFSAIVQLRNKTRAHGAVGTDFFDAAGPAYSAVVKALIGTNPTNSWRWLHLSTRANKTNRAVLLQGLAPQHLRQAEADHFSVDSTGVYVWACASPRPLSCAPLLRSNHECASFLLANGGVSDGKFEFLDYGSGATSKVAVDGYSRPPAPLPASETEGLLAFDIQSNVFGNLPRLGPHYVKRQALETELDRRLKDRNHSIITLHGRGGIGKTSLALRVAHALASEAEPTFDYIVWFSARDIDLKAHGPSDVRQRVVTLDGVARVHGALFDGPGTVESFAAALQAPPRAATKGVLFVFDNFETMETPREFHEFLDTHTHLPNKVLITSRERSFKADFPIEVHGMARNEALELIRATAAELGAEGIIDEAIADSIFAWSEGHPYVIRVIVGEAAKEGRYVAPKTLLPKRLDILSAVFERSFNRLSDEGRYLFLTVASWRSLVSELALVVVLGQRGFDIDAAIDECMRLSLIERRFFLDEQPAYVAPQVARVFAHKKLESDPDRLLIQEDLALLLKFGVLPMAEPVQVPQEEVLSAFIDWCLSGSRDGYSPSPDRVEGTLALLAELHPPAWLALARYRMKNGTTSDDVAYALRRAVEEQPLSKEAHLLRAVVAQQQGDESTFLASRLAAVEAAPKDIGLLREVASDVAKYINEHSHEIPMARRSIYLANLRERMRVVAGQLDATGLSRLAWLFLLEGNKVEAKRYAERGLAREPANQHCIRLVGRLSQQE